MKFLVSRLNLSFVFDAHVVWIITGLNFAHRPMEVFSNLLCKENEKRQPLQSSCEASKLMILRQAKPSFVSENLNVSQTLIEAISLVVGGAFAKLLLDCF